MTIYFPYEQIRGGQQEFINDIQTALNTEKHLVAHAPTGIGKTVSVLCVAIPFCLEHKKKLVYLIPKQTQHKIVVETIKYITEKFNLDLKVVDFIGKQAMCPNEEINSDFPIVFNIKCKNFVKHKACNYSVNSNSPEVGTLLYNHIYNVEEMCSLCVENEMCPYQIAIRSLRDADIIICDYNHLFTGLLAKKSKVEYEDMVIVFDEAHNLPDRSRDHQSDILTKGTIQNAINENKYGDSEDLITRKLDMMLSLFDKESYTFDSTENQEKTIEQSGFISDVQSVISSVFSDNDDISYTSFVDEIVDTIDENSNNPYTIKLAEFLAGWYNIDDATFRLYSEWTTRRDGKQAKSVKLEYRGLDPSVVVAPVASEAHSVILMSGTLYPMSMYQDLMGLEPERTLLKQYASPFPPENKLSIATKYITSQYKKRGPAMYMDIASMIHRVVDSTPGSCAVFFTSYAFMKEVINRLPTFTKNKIIVENKDMTKKDKDMMYDFISRRGGVLCGVMGGSLSEGYDYKNNVIKSIVLVGMPLSPPTIDSNNLVAYYSKKFGSDAGKKYGYVYPCLRSVVQAAGRGIRGPNDRCCIIYADLRYNWTQYSSYFDTKIQQLEKSDVIREVKNFWGDRK